MLRRRNVGHPNILHIVLISFLNVTACVLCVAGVSRRSMSVCPTRVEMEVPVWIDSTCLCVNARLATAVQSVTLTYVFSHSLLSFYTYGVIV